MAQPALLQAGARAWSGAPGAGAVRLGRSELLLPSRRLALSLPPAKPCTSGCPKPRRRRVDFSEAHAWEARQAFLANVAAGEAALDLADAALQIAAEDDALGALPCLRACCDACD